MSPTKSLQLRSVALATRTSTTDHRYHTRNRSSQRGDLSTLEPQDICVTSRFGGVVKFDVIDISIVGEYAATDASHSDFGS